MNLPKTLRRQLASLGLLTLLMAFGTPLLGKTLDNFNGVSKANWTDFTFQAGFGIPTQSDGRFRFTQPAAGQDIFSASQKTSESFELKNGRSIEFQVDIIEGGGKDSFAVLAFIPTENSAGTLAGYGLAKSTTDVLITKGIGKYFSAVDGPAANLKQNMTRLVLNLSAQGGEVTILTKVLDLEDSLKVLWQQRVVDTAAADVLVSGQDSPAAPYLTKGYFTLYLFQDFDSGAPESPYQVVYDNAVAYVTDLTVVDDFNDNAKTDWSDYTFTPKFGIPEEKGGQFEFVQPPAGQAIFSASQKTSRVFDLKDGERVQFEVDVVQGGAKDSFSILSFSPVGASPLSLVGYGLAKSTTDVLTTKGIGKYFVADAGASANLKQDNITLQLILSAREGSIEINSRILDKDANNAVIYDKTVVDTPAADVLVSGADSPQAPFISGGYFTLFLYQDYDKGAIEEPYRAIYDNARAWAPPVAANVAPIISEILPGNNANFLPDTAKIQFKVVDDQVLDAATIAVVMNGQRYTATSGLALAGEGTTRTASLGGLTANRSYAVQLIAVDSQGAGVTNNLYFDTFNSAVRTIEIEDYNFEGGKFIDIPTLAPEGSTAEGAYNDRGGIQDVDINDSRTSPRTQNAPYRTADVVRMQRSLDVRRAGYISAGGAENVNGVYDYDVGDIAADEWMNYTRSFDPGAYEVYLRESLSNLERGESVLELLTSGADTPNQTVKLLGSFLGTRTGFEYRNFPLTDGAGVAKVVLRLSGRTTLRLRHVTPDLSDAARYLNYLAFVPVPDPGLQRATVSSVSPAPDTTVDSVAPKIDVKIQNRDTTAVAESVALSVNGLSVSAQVASTVDGLSVSYNFSSLPASGSVNTARLVFKDNLDVFQTNSWSFIVSYRSLDSATRVSSAGDKRGFSVRVVQAPIEGGLLENSLQRAESQLSGNSSIPKSFDTAKIDSVINYSQKAPEGADGFFGEDLTIPGASGDFGTDNYAMEVRTYLDLPAGIVRLGVNADDGYKVASAAASGLDSGTLPLFFHNNGPGNETADIVVAAAGLYPFRLVWYERGGDAHVEWFSVDRTTGERTLLNASGGIAAYATVVVPSIAVQSAASLGGVFGPESSASINPETKTITLPTTGESRFYRLTGAPAKLVSIRVSNGGVTLKYE